MFRHPGGQYFFAKKRPERMSFGLTFGHHHLGKPASRWPRAIAPVRSLVLSKPSTWNDHFLFRGELQIQGGLHPQRPIMANQCSSW